MKLHSFVPFSALEPRGLPPFAEMEKAVRAMAKELVAARTAPIATSGRGRGAVRGAGRGAAREDAGGRSARWHAAAEDRIGGQRRRRPAERAGGKARAAGRRAHAVAGRRSAVGDRARQGAGVRQLPRRRRGRAGPARVLDREGRAQVAVDVAYAAQGDHEIERPRARAAVLGRARPRRHAAVDRREGPSSAPS